MCNAECLIFLEALGALDILDILGARYKQNN